MKKKEFSYLIMIQEVLLFVLLHVIAIIMLIVSVKAFIDKEPFHFWSGTGVPSEIITDIKSYNKANGIMWLVVAGIFFVLSVLALVLNTTLVGIISAVTSVVLVIVLSLVYHRIAQKYFVDDIKID